MGQDLSIIGFSMGFWTWDFQERSLWFWEPVLSAILLFWQTVAQQAALQHQLEMQNQRSREDEYQQSLQSPDVGFTFPPAFVFPQATPEGSIG